MTNSFEVGDRVKIEVDNLPYAGTVITYDDLDYKVSVDGLGKVNKFEESSLTLLPSGGIEPTQITPVDHSASYILGSNNTLVINDPNAPNFSVISIDMSQYTGKIILIKNTGDRNYFGIFSTLTSGTPGQIYSSRPSTRGTIVIPVDLFYTVNSSFRYLIYDYTSSNSTQGVPSVSVFDADELFP